MYYFLKRDNIMHKYNRLFPYKEIRKEQKVAIDFALKTLIDSDKKFCIIEAGTGVGKSAIGLTLGRYLDDYYCNKFTSDDVEYGGGSYFLTTQRILQEQYENDFGKPRGSMCSLYSASNYQCSHHKKNDCRTSLQMLKGEKKSSKFFKACAIGCKYKAKKKTFLESRESITNFPYFILESTYSGKITPRNVLIVDEAHNTESVLSTFVEMGVSQYFSEKVVKIKFPQKVTPVNFVKWLLTDYYPKLQAQILHFQEQIEKFGLAGKMKELKKLAIRYDMMTGHASKLEVFLQEYNPDNWIMEKQETEVRGYARIVYRAVDVSKFAKDYLFKMGRKVIFLSATILNGNAFAESLGLDKSEYDFISIPSPFPEKNRPIFTQGIGSMSANNIEKSLPHLKKAIEAIIEEHSNEKGIIHCHTYKIANYLKRNIKNSRLLSHNSDNRDDILKKHTTTKKPTILLSPSMTEGVDLKGELSRFQIICKIPYPYLGDQIVRKRMNNYRNWYGLQTAKSIVQSCGRSVRSSEDTAVTYILDSDWNRFYSRNKNMFPKDFNKLIIK
jgi:ATP-dependent DNA helicase DinG